MAHVVLACSGGRESTAAIAWLAASGAAVTAVIVDLGQPHDLEAARERAVAAGAERALVLDRRDAFLHEYAFKALAVGALSTARSPMSMALSRPVIAQAIVDVARDEQADAVAYAASGKGRTDLLGVLLRDLAPDLRVVAVDVDRPSRREAANLWGRSLPRDADEECARPAGGSKVRRAIGVPARVAITFERGTPTAVNGVPMPPRDLLASLATLASAQGVGLVTTGDSEPPQEIEEAPAALVLAAAYQAVTAATPVAASRDAGVSAEYAAIIREGRWFSPSRAALDSRVDAGGLPVTGTATLELHKGEITQHIS